MDFSSFSNYCISGTCLRRTIYNAKTCAREEKQNRCYLKYNKKQEQKSFDINEEDVQLTKEVWKRDTGLEISLPKVTGDNWKKYCRFWNCLTNDERSQFLERWKTALYICTNLDKAHIKGKGAHIQEKYNIENVVLLNRLTHNLLDQYKDPLTGKPITAEQRTAWFNRIVGKKFEFIEPKIKEDIL